MRRVQTRQTFKLRLLAFVLALALMWYSFNPTPRPITRIKREDELPDEKKRKVAPQSMAATLPLAFRPMGEIENVLLSPDADEDDFEWPEFIDG